jgi:hypothetical protein
MSTFMPKIAADIEALDYRMEDKTVDDLRNWQSILRKAGGKYNPTVVNGLGQYHNDGWPLEWAFMPAESVEQFLANDLGMRQLIEHRFDVRLTGYDYFSIDSSILTHRPNGLGYMYNVGRTLGCSADYQLERKRTVERWVVNSPYREMGLHLHFDLRPDVAGVIDKTVQFVSQLDEAMRPFHVQPSGDYKPWYRQAGVYRPKPYGVEYRSLGSSIINDAGKYATMLRVAYQVLDQHWGES